MSKYSYEFKLKIVQEYLNGPLGSHLLAKKYNIPSDTPIKNWINQYKKYEKEGLQTKGTKKKYSLNFKLDVLRFKQDTGASYKDTANAFGIFEPSIIANWKRTYLKEGAPGLNKSIGRSPKMSKSKPNKNKKNQNKKANEENKDEQVTNEIELLRKENEYLRIELEYLKKLKAQGLKDLRANNKQK